MEAELRKKAKNDFEKDFEADKQVIFRKNYGKC